MSLRRNRRALSIRPVHSEKHEITWSLLGLNASGVQTTQLVEAIDAPSTPHQVAVGASIKGFYIEFNLNGVDNSGTVQVFHWMVVKNVKGLITSFDPALYNQVWKSLVFKRGMEMLPEIPLNSGGTVQTKRIFFVPIPFKMQRMSEGDFWQIKFKSTSASGINFCGIAIYKAFV